MKPNAIDHLTKAHQTFSHATWLKDGQPTPLPDESLVQLQTVLDEVIQRIAQLREEQAANDKP